MIRYGFVVGVGVRRGLFLCFFVIGVIAGRFCSVGLGIIFRVEVGWLWFCRLYLSGICWCRAVFGLGRLELLGWLDIFFFIFMRLV